jgi:20S proteasome alpha/beta subunit
LKRSPNELAFYQKKVEKIDNHMGIGMSGLTADGRSLVKYVELKLNLRKLINALFVLDTCEPKH